MIGILGILLGGVVSVLASTLITREYGLLFEFSRGWILTATSIAIAGSLYRFDTFLVGFQPGPGWHYFPSFTEQFVTFGLISFEVLVYATLVKLFPILAGISKPARPVTPAVAPLTAPASTPAY